jgi:hypothetical protein
MAGVTEWKLVQKHAELGDVTILVAQDAVKIINKSLDYQIVAKAPTWRVVMYRTGEKKQCVMTHTYFTTTMVFRFLHPSRSLRKSTFLKLDSQKQGELRFTHYKDPTGREDFCLSDNIEVSQPVIDIIESYYDIKPSPGIPVRFTLRLNPKQKYPNESWFSGGLNMGYQGLTVFLRTVEAKKVPFLASDFQYPRNYKDVKSAEEMLLSNNQQKSFGSLMDDMGLGSKLGTGKK